MGVAGRISRDLGLIRGEGFAALCRTRPQDFTRRRKLPPDVLVESMLARRGRTLSIELRDVRREAGVSVSKPGYLRARRKLNPEALLLLMRHHAACVYEDGDFEALAGMVVVAIDGSTAAVPTTDETVALWGNASKPGAEPQATVGISGAYDPLSDVMVDLELDRGSFDERSHVMGHLLAAEAVTGGRPLLAVMDRGYPSLHLMAQLGCAGTHYLMRCSGSFLSAEFRRAEAAGGDLWIDVRLTRKRLRNVRDPAVVEALVALGTLRARFCVVDIGGDVPERIVTNVGEDVIPHSMLKEVYWKRWGVETCFEFMKDRLQMENLAGTSPVLIEQDIYATGYLVNVAFDLAREADAEAQARIGAAEEAGHGYKHEMAVNRTFAIGALKEDLYRVILADDAEREALMAALVREVSHELVPVRPDRPAYPRDGLDGKRARRYSNTHRRAF